MRARSVLALPVRDVLRGLERALDGGIPALALVLAGCVAGWFVYVPVHELLHALGCVVTGGTVRRLEIAPQYGGALLARVLPFVAAGGDHAGRLTGFDTHGSDLVYLATDLAPFVLTLFPGVWLLRRAGTRWKGALFGAALPVALAPFVSLTGDAYEIGSIVTTRLPPWSSDALRALLRGDDLFEIFPRVRAARSAAAGSGWVVALLLGVVWAYGTYLAGSAIARRLGAEPGTAPAPVAGAEIERHRV
jgi:hypothetical protein